MSRELLCKHEKGHLGQYEDWYYLDTAEDGSKTVIHEWDHVSVNGFGKNEGSAAYTVDEFLGSNHYQPAKAALREMIDK